MSNKVRALFGGSFDPPHFGHQMAILYLLEGGFADEVRVIPCAEHPFSKPLSPFADRLALCEAMVAPFQGRAVVDPVESNMEGASYSYRTAEAMADRFPKDRLRWVVGSDAAQTTHQWRELSRLEAVAPLFVLGRSGHSLETDTAPLLLPAVSSSQIRKRMEAGLDLTGFVPAAVLNLLER